MKQFIFLVGFISLIACNKQDSDINSKVYSLEGVEWNAKWSQKTDSIGNVDTVNFVGVYNWNESGKGSIFTVENKYALRYKAPVSGTYKLSVFIDADNVSTQIGKDLEFTHKFENKVDLRTEPLNIVLQEGEWFWINIFGLDTDARVNNALLEIVDVQL